MRPTAKNSDQSLLSGDKREFYAEILVCGGAARQRLLVACANPAACGRAQRGGGRINRYLNFLDQGRRYSLDYQDVLEQNDSRSVNYASTAGIKLEFAARSWLLTHYMLSSEENRTRLTAYPDRAAPSRFGR